MPLLIFALLTPSSLLSQTDPAGEWDLLYPKIRDRSISKEEAWVKIKELEPLLRELYLETGKHKEDDRLRFPVKGYDFHSIGGKEGSGYQIKGYDFFDGNQHKGHPGHDIFIHDKNQDNFDDRTGKPVEVINAASGIVVSINLNWKPSNPIRGGNYIWIYEPIGSRYYYYAHLNEILVKVGQIVSKGERIGTIGRTGLNAYPKRSPTHLHFAAYQSKDGYPQPINLYIELSKLTREAM
jgi:murein DD-endopeptidase MepM/ murein hydrolase activator NlpD